MAHLLEAMRALRAEGAAIDLILIGDGPMARDAEAPVLRTEARRFLGWLPNHEVRRFMRSALGALRA